MPTPSELVAAIAETGEAFGVFLESLDDARFHRRPAPDEWSAAELAGHAAEFPLTFSRQCQVVADNPGTPVGRQLDDPGRLAAIETLAGRGPAEAAGAVRAAAQGAVDTLSALPAAAWAATAVHPRFGRFTVTVIVEQFIAGHLSGHLEQARAASGQPGS